MPVSVRRGLGPAIKAKECSSDTPLKWFLPGAVSKDAQKESHGYRILPDLLRRL